MEVTIVLKVKDIEIKLTVDEARKLADTLNGLTGEGGIIYPWYPWGWHPTWTSGTSIPISDTVMLCSETT